MWNITDTVYLLYCWVNKFAWWCKICKICRICFVWPDTSFSVHKHSSSWYMLIHLFQCFEHSSLITSESVNALVKIEWRQMLQSWRLYQLIYRDPWTWVVILWIVMCRLALMHISWRLIVAELESYQKFILEYKMWNMWNMHYMPICRICKHSMNMQNMQNNTQIMEMQNTICSICTYYLVLLICWICIICKKKCK